MQFFNCNTLRGKIGEPGGAIVFLNFLNAMRMTRPNTELLKFAI